MDNLPSSLLPSKETTTMTLVNFTSPKLHSQSTPPFLCFRPPPSSSKKKSSSQNAPARDLTINFGKYRGKMLGSLPSKYLLWVSKNLRTRDFEGWARRADEVLADPVYKDRLEWESAERVLSGEGRASDGRAANAADELLEICDRLGWDYEDRDGWARIDFALLGTSAGGRIPRKNGILRSLEREGGILSGHSEVERKEGILGGDLGEGKRFGGETEDRRERRRERRRRRGEMVERGGVGCEKKSFEGVLGKKAGNSCNPFPGRGALLDEINKRRQEYY